MTQFQTWLLMDIDRLGNAQGSLCLKDTQRGREQSGHEGEAEEPEANHYSNKVSIFGFCR